MAQWPPSDHHLLSLVASGPPPKANRYLEVAITPMGVQGGLDGPIGLICCAWKSRYRVEERPVRKALAYDCNPTFVNPRPSRSSVRLYPENISKTGFTIISMTASFS